MKKTSQKNIAQPAENSRFGDKRLDQRAEKIIQTMSERCGKSLPEIFCTKTDLQGAYRFFNNDSVNPDKILKPHIEQTIERCKAQDMVAVIQDSSDIAYDYLTDLEGFDPMHVHVQKGFRIHPCLAINEKGTPLGVLKTFNYTRDAKKKPEKGRNSLPIEKKESYRWMLGYLEACKLAEKAPSVTVVSISDREGDIYECLVEAEDAEVGKKAHILVRSNHNRCLADTLDPTLDRLAKKLTRSPAIYRMKLRLDQGRSNARTADVVVRASAVLLKAPNTCKKKSLSPVSVNAVFVTEIDPPKGVKPIEWLLLTTLPIDTPEEVARVVYLYGKRWTIEIFFKAIKSGCKIDSIHLQTTRRIENYIALSMIVGWKTLLATYLPREYPDAPCTILFTDLEWKLAYLNAYKTKPLPEHPPTIKEAVMLVAMLGGYQKRKAAPGMQTIWKGIIRLIDMVRGFELTQELLLNSRAPVCQKLEGGRSIF